MFHLLRFTWRKCKHRCYGNGPPPAVTSLVTVARVTVRSSPTPNVHRGERRYHVKTHVILRMRSVLLSVITHFNVYLDLNPKIFSTLMLFYNAHSVT